MTDNPWLTLPLEDYESHMALPGIGQAQMLAEELARATSQTSAGSVALVGCSGGNGLATLPGCARRIVAIDINPAYVEAVRRRFGGGGAVLELFVADIQKGAPPCPPVDLVYAGLVFEYVDVATTMTALRGLCAPEGMMVAVIQLPSETGHFVSPSPFSSLQPLESRAHTRSRQELEEHALVAGFHASGARRITSAGGKRFDVLYFRG
jgi:protein-L-isoaspartate O-methyltransferase